MKPFSPAFVRTSISLAVAAVCYAAPWMSAAATTDNPATPSAAETRKSADADAGNGAGASAQDDEDVERMEVTARRRVERLQDVPVAVSALSETQLDNMGAQTIVDIERTVPNLTINASRGTNTTVTAYIRGIGQNDPLWGYEPGVGIYLDDVYIARPQGAVLDLLDLERIEVLRGPQGTLYGKNTMGGAIKYVTRELPTDYTRGYVEVGVGAYEQADFKAAVSTPIINDKLIIGGSIARLTRDGFGEVEAPSPYEGKSLSDKDIAAGRVNLTWLVNDDVKVKFVADDLRDESNARGGQRLVPSKVTGELPFDSRYDTRQDMNPEANLVRSSGEALTVTWNINPTWSFKSVSAYREGDTKSDIDFDQLNLPVLNIPAQYDDHQFSQEFQLSYEGDALSVVSGLYYFDGQACGSFDTVLGLLLPPTGFARQTSGCVDTKSKSIYAQASYKFAPDWSFTLGGRYDEDEKDATVATRNFLGLSHETGIKIAEGIFDGNETFDDFSPHVGLEYQITPDMMTYVSYSHGFKSGGFNMRGNILLDPQADEPFDPETVDAYELGLKGNWFDNRLSANLALFTQDYDDKQVTVNTTVANTPVQRVLNAAKATGDGAELELIGRVTDAFTVNVMYGYLDAEYDEFVAAIAPGGTPVDISNTAQIINAPEYQYTIGATYEWDLGGYGQLQLMADYNRRGDTYIFETPSTVDQPAYSVWNASMIYYPNNSNWRFSLHGRNLGDEEYRTGGYNFPNTGGDDTVTAFYGDPRTWTLSAAYTF